MAYKNTGFYMALSNILNISSLSPCTRLCSAPHLLLYLNHLSIISLSAFTTLIIPLT